MATFNDTFDISLPVGSSFARFGQAEIRTTRRSLQERLDLEHYGPGLGNQDDSSPTADGRHRPGHVSAVLLDTEANILAVTPSGVGSLAFATDTKKLFIWDGSAWDTYYIGGGMKQIIKGISAVNIGTSGTTTVNETIASVNTAKCLIFFHVFFGELRNVKVSLTSSTNLRIEGVSSGFGWPSCQVHWQIIEYV